MRNLLLIVAFAVAVVIGFVVYRYLKVIGHSIKQSSLREERIQPLIERLESGETVSTEDVRPFADGLLTREATYELLRNRERLDLFPDEYANIVSGAASNLAIWLEFPTELDTCPDQMVHTGRHTFLHDGRNFHYEVFKYRIGEPHWAAPNGWMLGAAGPYFDDSQPYDFPGGTFSRCASTMDNTTPEEEAHWIHENIGLRSTG